MLLTGVSANAIANLDPHSISSSKHSATEASVVTVGGATVLTTIAPTTSASSNKKTSGGSNTTGIAVGVVVGVLVLAALIGGVILFLRRRQKKLQQEEYEQKQSVQQFVAGGGKAGYSSHSQTSMGDSRLDPEVMMSRRQSDGSIMDNQDYSRRILKVKRLFRLPCIYQGRSRGLTLSPGHQLTRGMNIIHTRRHATFQADAT